RFSGIPRRVTDWVDWAESEPPSDATRTLTPKSQLTDDVHGFINSSFSGKGPGRDFFHPHLYLWPARNAMEVVSSLSEGEIEPEVAETKRRKTGNSWTETPGNCGSIVSLA